MSIPVRSNGGAGVVSNSGNNPIFWFRGREYGIRISEFN